jgi:hypothetical protein
VKRRVAPTTLVVVMASAAFGCDRDTDRERQSAADVVRAERSVREADNAQKARALGALEAPCVGQKPCEVQRICRAAYQLHVEALSLTAAAKQQLGDGRAEEAAKLLGSAQEKLQRAQGDVATCTERAGALRRLYKL